MKKIILSCYLLVSSIAYANEARIDELKAQIISVAQSYQGQGDPNREIQNTLDPMVKELLELAPQPPVAERLDLLEGTWQQVWGPYDYRGNNRGVDPSLKPDEIYQTIFAGGFYYNTSPILNGNKVPRIGLLKGRYRLDARNPNVLRVKFVQYPGVRMRPADLELWELPALAEAGQLPNRIRIVPTWVVRLFFGGGGLNEVYTDEDLRITYGTSNNNDLNNYLYILTRVTFKP